MRDFAKLREKNAKKAYLAELAKEGERAARLKAAKLSAFGKFPDGGAFAIEKRATSAEVSDMLRMLGTDGPHGEKICKVKAGEDWKSSRIWRIRRLTAHERKAYGQLCPGMAETLSEGEKNALIEVLERDRDRKRAKERAKAARTKSGDGTHPLRTKSGEAA